MSAPGDFTITEERWEEIRVAGDLGDFTPEQLEAARQELQARLDAYIWRLLMGQIR